MLAKQQCTGHTSGELPDESIRKDCPVAQSCFLQVSHISKGGVWLCSPLHQAFVRLQNDRRGKHARE